MRIACPHCGERGVSEFACRGEARARPEAGAGLPAWYDYAFVRENPAGPVREHWQHVHGCRRWLLVTRDTRTHAIYEAVDAAGLVQPGDEG